MSATKQVQAARDLKQRVLTCLHKLSDRDTHNAAASELESIAKTLSSDALPPFLSSISATDSSDRSPVRRHCLRLISVLSENHGNSLSPYLSKLLSAVSRRLRDPDSSVRSACVAACFSVSSHVTSPPFSSIAKPFVESLFSEQDSNAQNGAALCLAAVIEGSRYPDAGSLRRMLPRLEKLVKSESFKAKAAVLALIAKTVEVKGVLSGKLNLIKNSVECLISFLSSEDWAARKAAAEALIKIAEVDKYSLSEYKAACLKTFEAKRFDKVKATREAMNLMIDAWKEIPDLPDQVSPPPESQASCKENASDGRYPSAPRTSVGSSTPERKKNSPLNNIAGRTPLTDGSAASTARKRSPIGGNENKRVTAMFRKLDRKKPSDRRVDIAAAPTGSSGSMVPQDLHLDEHDIVLDTSREEGVQFAKPEIRRALFNENDENPKRGVFKHASRVVPFDEAGIFVGRDQRECEDLSLIRKQLIQIENQQANMFDLLQKFMGSSQNGMHSLEARVHGLELALDEISFDLAVSTGRISQNAGGAMCCKLPGSDFISSKLWGKTVESRSSTSRLPVSSGTPLVAPKNVDAEGFPFQNQKYQFQGGRGLIKNPLAEIPRGSVGVSEASSSGVVKNIRV